MHGRGVVDQRIRRPQTEAAVAILPAAQCRDQLGERRAALGPDHPELGALAQDQRRQRLADDLLGA